MWLFYLRNLCLGGCGCILYAVVIAVVVVCGTVVMDIVGACGVMFVACGTIAIATVVAWVT